MRDDEMNSGLKVTEMEGVVGNFKALSRHSLEEPRKGTVFPPKLELGTSTS
jgi:hypothetical protein